MCTVIFYAKANQCIHTIHSHYADSSLLSRFKHEPNEAAANSASLRLGMNAPQVAAPAAGRDQMQGANGNAKNSNNVGSANVAPVPYAPANQAAGNSVQAGSASAAQNNANQAADAMQLMKNEVTKMWKDMFCSVCHEVSDFGRIDQSDGMFYCGKCWYMLLGLPEGAAPAPPAPLVAPAHQPVQANGNGANGANSKGFNGSDSSTNSSAHVHARARSDAAPKATMQKGVPPSSQVHSNSGSYAQPEPARNQVNFGMSAGSSSVGGYGSAPAVQSAPSGNASSLFSGAGNAGFGSAGNVAHTKPVAGYVDATGGSRTHNMSINDAFTANNSDPASGFSQSFFAPPSAHASQASSSNGFGSSSLARVPYTSYPAAVDMGFFSSGAQDSFSMNMHGFDSQPFASSFQDPYSGDPYSGGFSMNGTGFGGVFGGYPSGQFMDPMVGAVDMGVGSELQGGAIQNSPQVCCLSDASISYAYVDACTVRAKYHAALFAP
jgi:hypothetical protein